MKLIFLVPDGLIDQRDPASLDCSVSRLLLFEPVSVSVPDTIWVLPYANVRVDGLATLLVRLKKLLLPLMLFAEPVKVTVPLVWLNVAPLLVKSPEML